MKTTFSKDEGVEVREPQDGEEELLAWFQGVEGAHLQLYIILRFFLLVKNVTSVFKREEEHTETQVGEGVLLQVEEGVLRFGVGVLLQVVVGVLQG